MQHQLREQQIASLRQRVPRVVQISPDASQWVIKLVDSRLQPLTQVFIAIPPPFPSAAPDVRVSPWVDHPWIDREGAILGHPHLGRNWHPNLDLGQVVSDILQEFTIRPPRPLPVDQQQDHSISSRSYPTNLTTRSPRASGGGFAGVASSSLPASSGTPTARGGAPQGSEQERILQYTRQFQSVEQNSGVAQSSSVAAPGGPARSSQQLGVPAPLPAPQVVSFSSSASPSSGRSGGAAPPGSTKMDGTPANSRPPGAGGDPPITIPQRFAEVEEALSVEQLAYLAEEADRENFNEFLYELDCVRDKKTMLVELMESNAIAARKNLEIRPRMEALTQKVAERYVVLQAAREEVLTLEKQRQELTKRFHPRVMHARMLDLVHAASEDAERLSGETSKAGRTRYFEARKRQHRLGAKADRLRELAEQGS
ncbi:unnamed protein product [Amoebophrya sp. A120]|nr:unnamed protein product [Amoebophrya sp. A120]|eukprot:GSA120T00021616001.1